VRRERENQAPIGVALAGCGNPSCQLERLSHLGETSEVRRQALALGCALR
jgi:hypothetical protein